MKPETKLAIGISLLLIFFWSSCTSKTDFEAPKQHITVITPDNPRIFEELRTENEIYFSTNSSSIEPEYQEILEDKAVLLKARRELKISLIGHTDLVGPKEYNNRLGYARAAEVKRRLIELGVNEKQIFVKTLGEREATIISSSDVDTQLERRVDLEIITPSRLSQR